MDIIWRDKSKSSIWQIVTADDKCVDKNLCLCRQRRLTHCGGWMLSVLLCSTTIYPAEQFPLPLASHSFFKQLTSICLHTVNELFMLMCALPYHSWLSDKNQHIYITLHELRGIGVIPELQQTVCRCLCSGAPLQGFSFVVCWIQVFLLGFSLD